MIHSQTTPIFSTDNFDLNVSIDFEPSFFKEYRNIRYREINEMLKYAKGYEILIKQDSLHKIQIEQQKNIIKSQDSIIDSYDNVIIPNFESEIKSKDYQIVLLQTEVEKEKELSNIRIEREELKLQKFKAKRIIIGLGGCYGFGDTGTGFNAGVVVSYRIFSF